MPHPISRWLVLTVFFALPTHADEPPEPLEAFQEILDVCSEGSVRACRQRFVGDGAEGRVFLSVVILINAHARASELYASRFGREELESWQRMIMFTPTRPQVTLVSEDAGEVVLQDEQGNRLRMVLKNDDWKLDLSSIDIEIPKEQVAFMTDLAGHYLAVVNSLVRRAPDEDVERALLFGAASVAAMVLPEGSEQLAPMMNFVNEMGSSIEEIREVHRKELDAALDLYTGKRVDARSTDT